MGTQLFGKQSSYPKVSTLTILPIYGKTQKDKPTAFATNLAFWNSSAKINT
ncbi:MAG: hypothetical protein OEW75_02625 [Cyclobacteriaceae bacterium]|nr:hypothetical protein [Cyclobacteriaceae bacterium]